MRSTLTMRQYAKPPFEPQACYVPARDLVWGDDRHGYVTIPAAQEDTLETVVPLEFERMTPPCDEILAARLYRTGFLAMLLTDDGQPLMQNEWCPPGINRSPPTDGDRKRAAELIEELGVGDPSPAVKAREDEPTGAVCPKCGRQFKGKFVPHFHKIQCEKAA